MKKYIACVEGLGEALFVVNIVRHAFSNVNAKIVTFTNGGGGRIPRYAMDRHEAFTRDATSKEFDFLFQIVNCGSDTQVMSYYLEISQNENFDFDYVFLLRDVYPDVSYNNIDRLRNTMAGILHKKNLKATIVLEIMELEAWLLNMSHDFNEIDSRIDKNAIVGQIGFFPPDYEDLEKLENTYDIVKEIFSIADLEYNKSRQAYDLMFQSFDYEELFINRCKKFSDLENLITEMSSLAS